MAIVAGEDDGDSFARWRNIHRSGAGEATGDSELVDATSSAGEV